MNNVLVVKEHFDEEFMEVYMLSPDDKKAAEQAKALFLADVEEEKRESPSFDENNTWWDDTGAYGQIAWDFGKATYDVTNAEKLPERIGVEHPAYFKSDEPEFIGQFMDVFEDFLEKHKDELTDQDGVILTGSKYDELASQIKTLINNWK